MRFVSASSFGLVSLFMLTGCDPMGAESKRLRGDLMELKERLEVQEEAVKSGEQTVQQAVSKEKALQNKLREMEAELKATLQKAAEMEKEFTDYKASYRITARKRAPGVKLASLATADGGSFSGITVLSVNPGEVRFQHTEGIASLPLGGLPEADRMRFGYDAEEAAAWMETRREEAARAEAARMKALAFGKTQAEKALLASSGVGDPKRSHTGNQRSAATAAGNLEKQIADCRRRQSSILSAAVKVRDDRSGCPVHRRMTLDSYKKEYASLVATIQKLSR